MYLAQRYCVTFRSDLEMAHKQSPANTVRNRRPQQNPLYSLSVCARTYLTTVSTGYWLQMGSIMTPGPVEGKMKCYIALRRGESPVRMKDDVKGAGAVHIMYKK